MTSMSRATSVVLMCIARAPPRAAHRLVTPSTSASSVERSAAESGVGSALKSRSMSELLRHCTGLDAPMPRGSKPTMSYAARTAGEKTNDAYWAYSTPEPPGPPGLMTREPMRLPGSVAGALRSARVKRSPFGLA